MPSEDMAISVIVLAYNTKEYIARCVESVLEQSFSNFELIIVDDGSTDGTSELADELAAKDNRIRIFHIDNGGIGRARNIGISHASNPYITFVDSDDYISPCFLESLAKGIEQTGGEICLMPGGLSFHDGERPGLIACIDDVPDARVVCLHEALSAIMYQKIDTAVQWGIYKTAILVENPLPEGYYYEDLASLYRWVAAADCVALIETDRLYAYYLRDGGIIQQAYRPIKLQSAIDVAQKLKRGVPAIDPSLDVAASSRCFSVIRMVIGQIPKGERDVQVAFSELKKYRMDVLCDGLARKRERLASLVSLFGSSAFHAFCRACRHVGLMR